MVFAVNLIVLFLAKNYTVKTHKTKPFFNVKPIQY